MYARLRRFFAVWVAPLGLVGLPAHANLALYDFTGQPGNQANTVGSALDANVSVQDLVRGSGLSLSSGVNSVNASGWSTGALDPDDYYAFGLAPLGGAEMTLTRLSFAERRSGTGITFFELRSSLDSFATAVTGTATSVPDDTLTRHHAFALDSNFADLSSPVEFRLYGYTAEGTAGTWRLENHSTAGGLRIEGSAVVIPEPASVALLAVGLLALRRLRPAAI
jgi:hypothetical protein